MLRRADMKISGMNGLYISIHISYQFINDNLEYRYKLSVNIVSFWGVRSSIGNIYIHSKKKKKKSKDSIEKEKAKTIYAKWFKNHQSNSFIIVGDFNITK